MKKLLPIAVVLAVFAGSFAFRTQNRDVYPDGIPQDKKAYDQWFAGEMDKLRAEYGDLNGANPGFYAFDRLKKVNPETGEIPENALWNAYNAVKQMQAAQEMRSGGTGATNKAIQWNERGPNDRAGRTRAFLFDPNDPTHRAAFAGGVGGGLWRCTNITSANPGWVNINPMFSNVAVTCLAHDPSDTQIIYFGTGEGRFNADAIRGAGIWKSTDGGATFDVLPSTQNGNFYYTQKIVVTSTGVLYAGTSGGVYKSADKGATFTKVTGNGTGNGANNISDMEIDANGNVFAAASGSGIFKSGISHGAQQGEVGTWTKLNANFGGNFDRIEMAIAPSNPNRMYAVTVFGFDEVDKVFRSNDGGNNWAPTGSEPGAPDFANGQGWYNLCIEVSNTDPNVVLVGGLRNYRTINGGNSWAQVAQNMHVDQHGIFFRPGSGSNVVFTNDGGIYYSPDAGNTVSNRNFGYNVTQFYSMSVDPRPGNPIIIGGTQDNGTRKIFQQGVSSGPSISGADGSWCAIDFLHPDTLYTTFQYHTVLRSRQGGGNTDNLTNPQLTQNDVLFINPLEMDVHDPGILYQASRQLWRHPNAHTQSGFAWTEATATLSSGGITAISFSETDTNVVYIGAGGSVHRLVDAHLSDENTVPQPVNPGGTSSGYVSSIAVNPADGNHLVITFTNYGLTSHVWETRNADQGANATWKSLQGNLPDLPVYWAVFEPNNNAGIVIGTEMGVFRCADIGQPAGQVFWTVEATGMGFPRVDMLEVRRSDNTIHAATHGRGFFSSHSYTFPPRADFGIAQDSACGGFVEFRDSSESVPNSWAWDFGDGGTSTTANPVHQYASSGTYSVTMIVANPNGTDTLTKAVNIVVLPPAVATAANDTIGCQGDSVQLWAAGGVSYSWFPEAGLDDPTSATPTAGISTDRTYVVTVTDANGCTDTDTVQVNMEGAPNTWAGQDKVINTVGDSVELTGFGGIQFLWTPSTGLDCDTCSNPMAYPPTTTIYTLTTWNAVGCSSSDDMKVTVNISTDLTEAFDRNRAAILGSFPNPFYDRTQLEFYLPEPGPVKFDLIGINGQLVRNIWQGEKSKGLHRMEIRREGLGSGLYFVRMETDGATLLHKIVVLD